MDSSSPFFRLSREIRDQIYQECLVTPNMIDISNLQLGRSVAPTHQRLGLHPTILAVSHEIYEEAIDILYGDNTFYSSIWADYYKNSPVCVGCAPKYLSMEIIGVGLPEDKSQAQWSASARRVRRLHISWSPVSLHDIVRMLALSVDPWQDVRDLRERCRRFPVCNHLLEHALPSSMDLQLLILHIGKRTVYHGEDVNRSQNAEVMARDVLMGPTRQYSGPSFRRNLCIWDQTMGQCVPRQISMLLRWARCSSSTIVLPSSERTQAIDFPRPPLSRHGWLFFPSGWPFYPPAIWKEFQRGSRQRKRLLSLTQTIPAHFLRRGQLACIDQGVPSRVLARIPGEKCSLSEVRFRDWTSRNARQREILSRHGDMLPLWTDFRVISYRGPWLLVDALPDDYEAGR